MSHSVRIATCARISSRSSFSRRRLRNTPSTRSSREANRANAAGSSGISEDGGHAFDQLGPVLLFSRQLLPPQRRQPIVFRAPVVLGALPFGGDQTGLLNAVQRRIEGALLDAQQIV